MVKMRQKYHELSSVRFDIINFNNKAISRSKRNDLFQYSSCSQFHYRHPSLSHLPPLLPWMVWHHKCQEWTNLKNQVEKPFPPDHLFCCSVVHCTSLDSSPSSSADGLTSLNATLEQSQASTKTTISSNSSSSLFCCFLLLLLITLDL